VSHEHFHPSPFASSHSSNFVLGNVYDYSIFMQCKNLNVKCHFCTSGYKKRIWKVTFSKQVSIVFKQVSKQVSLSFIFISVCYFSSTNFYSNFISATFQISVFVHCFGQTHLNYYSDVFYRR